MTSSALLHPDFLHLDCWLPWITFEHKFIAFVAILISFIVGSEALWGRVNVRSTKLRKKYFKEKKVWDDLKQGRGESADDEELGVGKEGGGGKTSDLNPQEDFSESDDDSGISDDDEEEEEREGEGEEEEHEEEEVRTDVFLFFAPLNNTCNPNTHPSTTPSPPPR